jgi:two-component system, NtrC family, response regulator GlrR
VTDLGHAGTFELSRASSPAARRFRLTVVEGPAAGASWESRGERCAIGSQQGNDLVVADPTVSRFHCEIAVELDRARIIDLGSTNGTVLDGVEVRDAYLRAQSLLRIGSTAIQFQLGTELDPLPISERAEFGGLVGRSRPMRSVFALLERAAASNATVLLEGETGTGKGDAALALHRASARGARPFVVVDCSAIPENLLESELFGHERGAFTGATTQRIGAFEEANGGTIFLDELGELPASLQPKLLRVLENREIRRVGANTTQKIDVRIVAASNRDLRAEANAGRFRSDLWFRIAVVRITLPPLRQRRDDLPLLAEILLERLGAEPEQRSLLATSSFLARLDAAAWPGNVRELRNYLERCLVYRDALPIGDDDTAPCPADPTTLPFSQARERALEVFEREYLTRLLRDHGGKMAISARAAGIGRVYLYKLLVRHGMK